MLVSEHVNGLARGSPRPLACLLAACIAGSSLPKTRSSTIDSSRLLLAQRRHASSLEGGHLALDARPHLVSVRLHLLHQLLRPIDVVPPARQADERIVHVQLRLEARLAA